MAGRNDVEAIRLFLDDLWKQAQGMLSRGKVKAEQATHAAKVKMDMFLLGSKKEALLANLGEAFYATTKRRKPSPRRRQKLFDILAEIREVEAHEKGLRMALRKGPAAQLPKRRGRPPGKAGVKKPKAVARRKAVARPKAAPKTRPAEKAAE